jgi:hypothetical protein
MVQKSGKIIKTKSGWIFPYKKEHPTDQLKIKLLLNEKIKGERMWALKQELRQAVFINYTYIKTNTFWFIHCVENVL